ncbi:MAG: type II secretion system protein GspM, partial [Thermodesulfobacteriota bacterium]|nr:type II secretion system protein GspM [Thermodesulfobacteriota bacterium]
MGISRQLSGKKSPLLRYGLLVIGLIFWYSLVWNPLSGKLEELDSRLETQEAKIGHLKRDIKRHRGVDQRVMQSERRLVTAVKGLMPGDTPQLVASNLQNILLKMASEADLQVITYKTGRVRKWRGYQLAVAKFSAKTDIRKLVKFLKLLDDDRRVFRIQSMRIIKVRGRNPHLRVSLEVEALFMKA